MFREDKIVLSFAAMSDVHITKDPWYDASDKLKNAIDFNNSFLEKEGTKLDAYCFCGDMLDRGWESQAEMFSNILLENIKEGQKIFFSIGNHEHLSSPGAKVTLDCLRKDLGEKFFEDDLETREEYDLGLRKVRINGYLFIAIQPENWYAQGPTKYTKERLDFLDNALREEEESNPNKYVFVFNHSMAYDTCYGSTLDGADSLWNTTELTSVLSKYPNVVLIGGHLHFPLNDERSIMQTSFTSMGDGCVTYMAIENGNYEYMVSRTVMRDRLEFSQNLIIQIDDEGNLRIRRIDCYNKGEIKTPWMLDKPNENKTHLNKYTKARGDNKSCPLMTGKAFLSERVDESGKTIITLTFDSATDDDLVHRYVVKYYENGLEKGQKNILADFYKHLNPKDMKKQYTLDLCEKNEGVKYSAKIYAINSWDKESNIMST